jgi:hypothetical protein
MQLALELTEGRRPDTLLVASVSRNPRTFSNAAFRSRSAQRRSREDGRPCGRLGRERAVQLCSRGGAYALPTSGEARLAPSSRAGLRHPERESPARRCARSISALRNRKPLRLVVRPVSGVGRRAVVPRVACGAAVQVLAGNRTPGPRAFFADLARGYPQARHQSQAPGTSDRRRRFLKYHLTARTRRDGTTSQQALRSRTRRHTTTSSTASTAARTIRATSSSRARRATRPITRAA